jgi:hypothetical protein
MRGKKPHRTVIVGIDGSGKTPYAKQRLSQETDAGLIELGKFDRKNKFFYAAGKAFDRLAEGGKKGVLAANIGRAVVSPFYRVREEKGKEKMFFVRYVPYDIEAFSKLYGGGKATAVLKRAVKFASASPRPDELILMESTPGEAMEIIKRRKKTRSHETPESLGKMAAGFAEAVEKAEKQGIKVRRIKFVRTNPEDSE